MLYQAIWVLKCWFVPFRSTSVPLVTWVSFSSLDGVKSSDSSISRQISASCQLLGIYAAAVKAWET
jgi:hypothetical protein